MDNSVVFPALSRPRRRMEYSRGRVRYIRAPRHWGGGNRGREPSLEVA